MSVTFSKERLREVYVKSCSHEGYLNIYIYRKLSLWCAVVAAKLGISPNQVTLLSFLSSLIACAFFLTGNYQLMLWGLLPFHIGKILDCADGQLAALADKRSALGAFLDPFLDRIVDIATLLALAIGYRMATGHEFVLWMVFAFVVVWFVGTYLEKESDGEQKSLSALRETTSGANPILRKLLKWDGGFTGLVITLAVVFIAGIPWVVGLFLVVATLPVPLQFMRVYKQLRAKG